MAGGLGAASAAQRDFWKTKGIADENGNYIFSQDAVLRTDVTNSELKMDRRYAGNVVAYTLTEGDIAHYTTDSASIQGSGTTVPAKVAALVASVDVE